MKVTGSYSEGDHGTDRAGPEGFGELGILAEERGLDAAVLSAAGIKLDSGGRYAGWWRLPYPHRGSSSPWKYRYRNPDPGGRPKYLDPPGADPHLYNPGLIGPGEDEVWIAEGEFDTLTLIQHGLKAVGIHGAAHVPGEEDGEVKWGKGFHYDWRFLFEGTLVIVAFDNDEQGRKYGRRLAAALEAVVFDDWPDDVNDWNQWHKLRPGDLDRTVRGFRTRVRSERGMEAI